MLIEERHSRESFRTSRASVFFYSLVRLLMSAQVAAVSKTPVTGATLERVLADVRSNVALQKPRSGERFGTKRTSAGERVGPAVHL